MRTSARNSAALAAMALVAATLSACDHQDMAQANREGAAIGQKSSEVLATATEKLKEAGARTQQTLEHGAQKLRASASENGTSGAASTSSGGAGATTRDDGRWNDTAITASIKADFLKDPDLSVFKIDVDTKDGVVTLNGLAQDEAAKKRAESLAQGIKGVREVRNFLVIKKA